MTVQPFIYDNIPLPGTKPITKKPTKKTSKKDLTVATVEAEKAFYNSQVKLAALQAEKCELDIANGKKLSRKLDLEIQLLEKQLQE